MMKRWLGFLVGALTLHGVAHAQVVTTTVNVTATADTQASRILSGTNWGLATMVQADGYTKPELVRALFGVSQTSIVNAIGTRNFTQAKLVLTLTQPASASGSTATLDAFRLNRAWSEGSATWNSVFGPGEPFDTAHPSASVTVADGATGTISFDVTRDIAAFLQGTPNYGWVIKDNGFNDGITANFATREASVGKPVLVIESTADPLATPATFTFSATPGVTTIDATVNDLITVPVHGQTFANVSAAVDWAVKTLNAKPVLNASGHKVDAILDLTEIDDIYYIDEHNNVVPVDDVISSLLGGQDGIVTVAGTHYCILDTGCVASMTAKQPPAVDRKCDSSGKYCIKGTSFKKDWIFYKAIGTKLEQKEGGYHKWHKFCWKHGFIPWSCKHTSGSNKLSLTQQFQIDLGTGAAGVSSRLTTGTNTTKISKRLWSIFASLEIDSNGSLSDVNAGRSGFGSPKGVCATGSGSDTKTGAAARTLSSKGSVDVTPACSTILF
ncbi:MAG: hypothetical protein JWN04_169 [Myxococcaceae bacterium]|nr:hypothetical protein [Myxococcaceae bacterium]